MILSDESSMEAKNHFNAVTSSEIVKILDKCMWPRNVSYVKEIPKVIFIVARRFENMNESVLKLLEENSLCGFTTSVPTVVANNAEKAYMKAKEDRMKKLMDLGKKKWESAKEMALGPTGENLVLTRVDNTRTPRGVVVFFSLVDCGAY